MLVDLRPQVKLLLTTVTFFGVEGYQLQRHGWQLYLGEVNDTCNYLAKIYWLTKEGINSVPNQPLNHSP